MLRRQSGFTRASALGPIADFMDRQGGSIDRVFRDVDLPLTILESPETLVPLREQFRLLERAARETGDPHFGARLGQNVRMSNLSAFGRWVAEAGSLAETIERSARGLNKMLQTATVLTLTRDGPVAEWSIEFLDSECTGRYQNELLGLSYMIDAVRCHEGRAWTPNLVVTTAPRRSSKVDLEAIFGTNVTTGRAVPAIQFDSALLDRPSADRQLTASARNPRLAEEPGVPGAEDVLATISAVTALALCEGLPRIDWVASKLGLPRRSLQRRLAEAGTTFGQVVEDLLQKRAEALLRTTSQPVTHIALQLGYAETAHFTRAFKRWHGITPSDFRRSLQTAS
jgi:AraC-like DNA-binding protein